MRGAADTAPGPLERLSRGVSEAASALSMIRDHPTVVDTVAGEALEAIVGRLFDLCDRADGAMDAGSALTWLMTADKATTEAVDVLSRMGKPDRDRALVALKAMAAGDGG